ncbi:MAG: hypothetical protein ABFD50_12580 [Smithella sp.]
MEVINSKLKNSASSLIKSSRKISFIHLFFIFFILTGCGSEFGNQTITKPDEFRHTYEANERVILNATARILKDKKMGSNVKINREKNQVETDYIIEDDWRTKSLVKVKKLNWKEREVILSITTEKKTQSGWEMRRLLEVEQYVKLFDNIDLAIYEEMAKVE